MEEPIKRDYSMPDSELAALATLFAGFATADLADVAKFGITAPKIAALVAKQEVFEDFPPDTDYAGLVTEATTAKDNKRDEIQVIVDEISTRAELEYANNRGRLNRFGFAKITNATDDLYLTKVEQIADLTEEYLADLTDRGQTQEQIDDLRALRAEFKTLVTAKRTADEARTEATGTRAKHGNELYAMVTEISAAGKAAYINTNYAKYQKYIIYDSDVPQTPPDPPTGLQVDIQTLVLTWLAVAGATGYKVMYKYPADSGSFIDAHAGILPATEFTLTPQAGSFKVVVLANNAAGLSDASEELLVAPGLASPGGFTYDGVNNKFTWVLVAGVSFYRLEASYDGGQTWNEVSAQNFTVGEYVWSPPPGTFRLRGELNGDVSAWVTTTV